MRKLLSKATVDVQWAFISIATASLAHFILRIILGRELGADGLGVYTLAFTIYLLGMQFAAFGIGSALTKYVAEFIEDRSTVNNYVSSGMTSSIITGALMGIAIFLLAPFLAISVFHTPELEGMIRLTALAYPFIAIQKAVLGTLNGFRRMRSYAYLYIAQNVTVVIASIVLVNIFKTGEMGAVIGLVGPTIIVSAACPWLIRDCLKLGGCQWNTTALRATAAFGFYIVLGNSISYLSGQVDSILIGYFMNPTEVGIYAVSLLFVQTLSLIPNAVQSVTTPITATLYGKGDIEGVSRVFYSTLRKSLLISIGLSVLLAICSPFFIALLFSSEFSLAYVPLLILLPGYAIGASFGAVSSTFGSIGKVKIPYRISAVGGVMNAGLNLLLIPIFGINGAALATSVSMLAGFLIGVKVIRRYLSVSINDPKTRKKSSEGQTIE